MGVSKKNSRKITVNDHEFRWRATGNDGWITVVIWPVENENSRLVGEIDYHSNWVKVSDDISMSTNQIVVTNRIIREIILFYGVDVIIKNHGQKNIGAIEEILDINGAVRNSHVKK